MTHEEYNALPGVRWTHLKAMRRSPRHYRAAVEAPPEDKDAYRLGRAVHCAVFEPLEYRRRYALWDGGRRQGKVWDEFAANCAMANLTPLTRDQWVRSEQISNAVRFCPLVAPTLEDGQAEVVVRWKDEKTGLSLKARVDWVAPGMVLDLKTSRHAGDARLFASSSWTFGYAHQMAYYARGLRATGHATEEARLVAVEPEPPFDVAVFRLSEDLLWKADQDLDALLLRLAQCQESDAWPGTAAEVQVLEAPRWAFADEEGMEVPAVDWIDGVVP